jgi:nucleotide-binding universal stress UspA family protein
MYENLIAGYDDTAEARDGLALAQMLAQVTGASITAACVVGRAMAGQVPAAEKMLGELTAGVEPGRETKTRVVRARSGAQGLHDLAEQEGADLLVLGSTHRGRIGRVLVGSTAERLLASAPCAVAVAPRDYSKVHAPSERPRVIAVGFDGYPESREALDRARELAEAAGATLRVVAVHEPDALFGHGTSVNAEYRVSLESDRARLEGALSEALEALPSSVRAQGTMLSGSVADVLAAEAEKGVDLLVVGSRGYGPLMRAMVGGVSARLMHLSPCPVLVLPRRALEGRDRQPEAAIAEAA